MEESRQTTDIPFVNEIVMNDNTLRKIMLDLWTHKTGCRPHYNQIHYIIHCHSSNPLYYSQSDIYHSLLTYSMILIFRIYNKKETLQNQRSSHF